MDAEIIALFQELSPENKQVILALAHSLKNR